MGKKTIGELVRVVRERAKILRGFREGDREPGDEKNAALFEECAGELETLLELERAGDRDYVTFVAERKVIEKARAFFALKSGDPILVRIVDLESAVRDLNACESTKKIEELKPRKVAP